MSPEIMQIRRLFDVLDPLLSHAAAHNDSRTLQSARRLLTWVSTPAYAAFDPAEWLHISWPANTLPHCERFIEKAAECIGDPDRMMDCLTAVAGSVILERDSSVAVELFDLEERGDRIPCIALGLDGPGRFPAEVRLDGFIPLDMSILSDCWTLATRGGRIDPAPNGWVFRLTGIRQIPEILPEAELLLNLLPQDPASLGKPVWEVVDGPTRFAPGDIASFLREIQQECDPRMNARGVAAQYPQAADCPPLTIARTRFRTFWMILYDFLADALPPDAKMTWHTAYAPKERQWNLCLTLDSCSLDLSQTPYWAGLQRAMADHHGTLSWMSDSAEGIFEAAFPDPVGQALDDWMPGWDGFSPRSQQVLRLLKCGEAAPPPEVLLPAVLEEELDRWFWERLSQPVIQNMAHEISAIGKSSPGSNPERMKKALTQLARGKPKRELCQPQYLGEILAAFGNSERGRSAVGLPAWDQAALEAFCHKLLTAPPAYTDALRDLAAYRPKSGG